MSTAIASAAHDEAIAAMRKLQRAAREDAGLGAPLFDTAQLARALASADIRERAAIVDGDRVRSGLWRFNRETEKARWARTRRILERASPGPDEDGHYLEMIARQAAAVEMVLCGEHIGQSEPRGEALCERMLLCTLPTQNLGAYADGHGDFYFVQLSAGLLDFAFQATKATVMSWKHDTSPDGSRLSFSSSLEDVRGVLDADPAPIDLLRRTLERYLFEGVARVRNPTPAPSTLHQPLDMLTGFNERFIVAHEIAHVLHDVYDVVHPEQGMAGEEFAADIMAFGWLLKACWPLDRVTPDMAAQGAFFVVTALEILRQARDLVRHGEVRADPGDSPGSDHPSNAQRFGVLREAYLNLVSREDDDLSIVPALLPSRTLELLWERLLASGAPAAWKGRPLHRIWDGH